MLNGGPSSFRSCRYRCRPMLESISVYIILQTASVPSFKYATASITISTISPRYSSIFIAQS